MTRLGAAFAGSLGIVVALVALVPRLEARPTTQSQFFYVYRVQPKTTLFRASCKLCHVDRAGRKLNKYGQDLRKAGHFGKYEFEGFRAIEKLDSDKDGFTNGEEIAAQKLPGSRVSRPKGPRQKPPADAERESAKGSKKPQPESESEGERKNDEAAPEDKQ